MKDASPWSKWELIAFWMVVVVISVAAIAVIVAIAIVYLWPYGAK